jgi:phosphoribosyl 1,2-cyclic phosphate phosphodiesterase
MSQSNKGNSITLLGTGTSVGIPMVGCTCEVCLSPDIEDKRLRTSAFVVYEGKHILIDIGPDFREQALRNQINKIDAIVLTHPHRDHIGGFDDIRGLNFVQEKSIALFANTLTWNSLKKQFYYAFDNLEYDAVPKVNLTLIENDIIDFEGIQIIPIHVMHGNMPCVGYRFGKMAYLTDVNFIPESEFEKLQDLDILILDSLRIKSHPSHFSLDESLAVAARIGAKKTYLIHLSHHMGRHHAMKSHLPENVFFGIDNQVINF